MKHNYKIFGSRPIGVVVEMGLGACLSEWIPMAKLLAKNYGVLLYERAGINKSEISINERTPGNIASELYDLLKDIDHLDKIVIVAHSQGGLYAQQFCRLYPDMVGGVVLLDPLSANDNKFKEYLSDKEYKKSGVDKSGSFKIMCMLAKFKLGFLTKGLLKNAPPFYYYDGYDTKEVNDILDSADKVTHADTALEEYKKAHERSNTDTLTSKVGFPNIPLVLITHSSTLAIEENMKFGNNTREFAAKVEEMWQNLMKEYLSFSEKSTWISAEKSTHYIHLTEPNLVVNALEKVIKYLP